jgi:hypothetical protein
MHQPTAVLGGEVNLPTFSDQAADMLRVLPRLIGKKARFTLPQRHIVIITA